MYIVCCWEEKEETNIINIAEDYAQKKIKPRPRIYLNSFNSNEIKASRSWEGLNMNNDTIFSPTVYVYSEQFFTI